MKIFGRFLFQYLFSAVNCKRDDNRGDKYVTAYIFFLEFDILLSVINMKSYCSTCLKGGTDKKTDGQTELWTQSIKIKMMMKNTG